MRILVVVSNRQSDKTGPFLGESSLTTVSVFVSASWGILVLKNMFSIKGDQMKFNSIKKRNPRTRYIHCLFLTVRLHCIHGGSLFNG